MAARSTKVSMPPIEACFFNKLDPIAFRKIAESRFLVSLK